MSESDALGQEGEEPVHIRGRQAGIGVSVLAHDFALGFTRSRRLFNAMPFLGKGG